MAEGAGHTLVVAPSVADYGKELDTMSESPYEGVQVSCGISVINSLGLHNPTTTSK